MSKCLDQCERLLENVLIVQSLQWPTFLPSEYISELDIVAALKKQLDDKRGKVRMIVYFKSLECDFYTIGNLCILSLSLSNCTYLRLFVNYQSGWEAFSQYY